jgi:hypothetical protein
MKEERISEIESADVDTKPKPFCGKPVGYACEKGCRRQDDCVAYKPVTDVKENLEIQMSEKTPVHNGSNDG